MRPVSSCEIARVLPASRRHVQSRDREPHSDVMSQMRADPWGGCLQVELPGERVKCIRNFDRYFQIVLQRGRIKPAVR